MAIKSHKATKTTKVSTMPVLVPRPNGRGALNAGGTPGNAGGTGRPPSVIRERLRGSFSKRIPILEEIADGEPVEHFEASFLSILPHVQCPKCTTQMEAKDPAALFMLTIPAKRSARPGDRIKATDILAKYGFGENDVPKSKVLALIGTWREILSKHSVPETLMSELGAATRDWELKL